MNKTIDDLIQRSPLRYNAHQTTEFRKEELAHFAKLIVLECMEIADKESHEQGTDHGKQAADEIWNTIRNRFGIN